MQTQGNKSPQGVDVDRTVRSEGGSHHVFNEAYPTWHAGDRQCPGHRRRDHVERLNTRGRAPRCVPRPFSDGR